MTGPDSEGLRGAVEDETRGMCSGGYFAPRAGAVACEHGRVGPHRLRWLQELADIASKRIERLNAEYPAATEQSPVVPSVGVVPVEVPEDIAKRFLLRAEIALGLAQCTEDPCQGHGLAFHEQAQASVAALVEVYPLIGARVRAEERGRVAGLIRENAGVIDSFARDGSPAGLIAYLINDVLGAGSAVPMATTPDDSRIANHADVGHQFTFTVEMRGEGCNWSSTLAPVTVRAYNLRDAIRQAEAVPFAQWFSDEEDDDQQPVATPGRRTAHDATVAAQALMGVVGEIDDLEAAELVTRRAVQFEQEARDLATVATPTVPVDEVVCPNCEQTIRARMSDAPADEDGQATVALTRDGLDGGWVAVLSAPPGCMSQGETIPGALRNLAGAAAEVAEVAAALALAAQDGQR